MSLATSVRPDPSKPASPTTSPGLQRQIERRHDAPPPQSLGQKDRLPLNRCVRAGFEALLGLHELAPEHQRDQFQPRQLPRRGRPDQAPVAQHGYAVGDPVHLIDEMGDEDDRDAARLEIAQDAEQQLGLVGVEAGGRLVEHQNPRVLFERAGDRDQLLNRDRIGAERALDVDVDIEPREPLARDGARLAPGNQAEPARLAAEREVLGHRHGRDEIDFLVDRADAHRARLAGRADIDGAAVDANFALVAANRAGHDLDQRRLAGAVLSHQRMHFAGLDAEIDAIQRPHAGKRLGNAEHFDPRRQGLRHARRRGCQGEIAPSAAFAQAAHVRADESGVPLSSETPPVVSPAALAQPPGVAAVCRSDGMTTHFGSSFLSLR